MKWHYQKIEHLGWSKEIDRIEQKKVVAARVAERMCDGQVVGFGSGSTAYLTALAIAKRMEVEGLRIEAIPTSQEITYTCHELGIPVVALNEKRPDWCFDGADEVDPGGNLIKGRGGALFLEKLVMKSTEHRIIVVDESKLVTRLGAGFAVPIEISPMALKHVVQNLEPLGAREISLRPAQAKDGPLITEAGNLLLDVSFDAIGEKLEGQIKAITGVVESGLFWGYAPEIITAGENLE